MNNPELDTLDPRIESHIDAFEECLSENGTADIADFLPERSDSQFLRIATELVRVDLELSWESGRQKSLSDYTTLLPELNDNETLRTEIAFEEFRQRAHHGQAVSVEQFSSKYNITPDGWSTIVATGDQTTSDVDFEELAKSVPTAGQRWRDFEVIREIGRGAMSRVLLAKQTSLSGRQVVLKFSPKHFLEAEKLAQLQHPNIVPVFSVYEDQEFHVFCMPYMGDVTLSQRELPLSELEVLAIGAKLADAIQHAHARGILHNDIKPANVLWSDGQPMLLDFNLAAELATPTHAHIGGTLPYMAPESLQGLQRRTSVSDEQTDIYSLGVLLSELATGKKTFGEQTEVDAAITARRDVAGVDVKDSSPAFQSIIRKCLSFEPSQRYRSTSDLLSDLNNQQNDLPLQHAENTSRVERIQKWCRRHPRLTSATSLATICVAIIAFSLMAWTARERHFDQLKASATFTKFKQDADAILPELSSVGLDAVNIAETLAKTESLLSTYIDDSDEWTTNQIYVALDGNERDAVDARIKKLAMMTSSVHSDMVPRNGEESPDEEIDHNAASLRWFRIAERLDAPETEAGSSKSMLLLRTELAGLETTGEDRAKLLAKIKSMQAIDSTDLQLVGWLKRRQGRTAAAIEDLRQACDLDPKDYSKWFNLSRAYVDANRFDEAEHCLTTCLALQPDSALARYTRGLCRREVQKYQDAIDDFTKFLEIAPKHPYGLLNRAIAYKQAGQLPASLRDLNEAISLGFDSSRPLLIRSRVRSSLGDQPGATDDFRKALAATPRDELGWIARGSAKMEKQPQLALEDFEQALRLYPRSHGARRNMAYVLSEKLSRLDEAIECLNQLIEDYPLDRSALGGRGVLLARSKQFDKAIEDARQIVALNGGPRALLQAACIYSMASVEQPALQNVAVSLLGSSFKVTPKLVKLAEGDGDLTEIHDFQEFKELCTAAKRFAQVPSAGAAIENTPRK